MMIVYWSLVMLTFTLDKEVFVKTVSLWKLNWLGSNNLSLFPKLCFCFSDTLLSEPLNLGSLMSILKLNPH